MRFLSVPFQARWWTALLVAGSLLSAACHRPGSRVDAVKASGVLRVASVYGRTTCRSGPDGLVGYEYDLAQGIAHSLGVSAEVLFTHSAADAAQAVIDGRADIAAAAITPSIALRDQLRFTSAVDRAAPQLVFRLGNERPKAPADLNGKLVVPEGAGYAGQLSMLSAATKAVTTETTSTYDAEDLLFQVASGDIDYTIASSSLVSMSERYYPQIRTAFDVGDAEDVVMALKRDADTSLFDAAQAYLRSMAGKPIARLHDRYYGHVEELDYFSAVQVATHMRSRLPTYMPLFKAAAERHHLDWRLLAAIGYQESHWDPHAISYTGVRGLMMLTGDTATRYKVANRDDPAQSIEGGARVLEDIFSSIPPEIQEPDRSWMALAAYNQGIGHLMDAWALTAARGGDPKQWVDVRDTYPLLSRPRWADSTKYGYARGREAVDFVANIRAYFDLITMFSSGARLLPPPQMKLDARLRTAKADAVPEPEPALPQPEDSAMLHPKLATDETLDLKPSPPHPTPRLEESAVGHSAN